jgi:hypothetical protein
LFLVWKTTVLVFAIKTDDQADKAIQRICRKAGLPVRHWHTLRHAFGTHAALFGVNPCGCRRGSGTSGSTRRCSTFTWRRRITASYRKSCARKRAGSTIASRMQLWTKSIPTK